MSLSDVNALAKAVRSEVERDRDRVLNHARSEARRLRDQARAEAETDGARLIQDAEKATAQSLAQARASAGIEAQSLRLESREGLLDRVFDQAAERLEPALFAGDHRQIVEALLRDAVAHLGNVKSLQIVADPVSRGYLGAETLAQLSEETGIKLTLGVGPDRGAGLVAQSPDGHLFYDNTFQARMKRMRSSLRASVYQILLGGEP